MRCIHYTFHEHLYHQPIAHGHFTPFAARCTCCSGWSLTWSDASSIVFQCNRSFCSPSNVEKQICAPYRTQQQCGLQWPHRQSFEKEGPVPGDVDRNEGGLQKAEAREISTLMITAAKRAPITTNRWQHT